MSDLKLFRLHNGSANEIQGEAVALERSLQDLIEANMPELLGVTFLAREYATGPKHKGRIDSLGIDENLCPVIIEYKRATNENVINQGLFYLDWLMDHQAEFKWLVMEQLGKEQAEAIDWSAPRLLCIAGGFNRYDEHAVQQMNRNIELIRYRRFGTDLFLLELVNATTAEVEKAETATAASGTLSKQKTFAEYFAQLDGPILDVYEELRAFIKALGDDVQEKPLKHYVAFKRLKNFACLEVFPGYKQIKVFLKVDPATIVLEDGFSRDVSKLGHLGTGDLELTLSNQEHLDKARDLIVRSYENS